MIHLSRITRKYTDHTAPARKIKTAELANELAEERISRDLVGAHNERVRERRSELYYAK